MKAALRVGDKYGIRQWTVMSILATLTANAYKAVLYIGATTPEDSKRKPTFALVIPAINRQLLDFLFTLVYMFDDFPERFPIYDRAGYRGAAENAEKFHRFARDSEWRDYLRTSKQLLASAAEELGLSQEERRRPQSIPYWPTPTQLIDLPSPSRPFLRWLFRWLYSDTSDQAHVGASGLLMIGSLLLSDVVGGQAQELIEKRTIRQYHFMHITRTLAVTLAIATELDKQFTLGNAERIAYLWKVVVENVPEAKEMHAERYAAF